MEAKIMKTVGCFLLAASLLFSQGVNLDAKGASRAKDKSMLSFSTNRLLSKGGVGIIMQNLYVDLKSAKNELILSAGARWTGQDVPAPEAVIFFEGKIWSPQALPSGFDLS